MHGVAKVGEAEPGDPPGTVTAGGERSRHETAGGVSHREQRSRWRDHHAAPRSPCGCRRHASRSRRRTSTAIHVGARPPHQSIRSSRRASPQPRSLWPSPQRPPPTRRPPAPGAGRRDGLGLSGAALVIGGGLGATQHRHAELECEQRLVGHQVDDDVVDGQPSSSGGSTGRVQSSTVRSRRSRIARAISNSVDVDRRCTGDHLGRRRRRRASARTRKRSSVGG